jgi:hypothetical protein
MENFSAYKKNYLEKGTAYIKFEENIFTEEEILELQRICFAVPKEHVEIGDAGESNYLKVGRFMTDTENPMVVNEGFSTPLIKILNKNTVKGFISKILDINENDIFYRRIQFNEIFENCFVGLHLDTDSNPDYLAACVIQVGEKFEGGMYRVYQKDKSYFDYKPDYGSLIISDCRYPHEVTRVTKGVRGSLVFFISKFKGKNRRKT